MEDKQRALLELFDPIKKDLEHQVCICIQVLKECMTSNQHIIMVLLSYYFLAQTEKELVDSSHDSISVSTFVSSIYKLWLCTYCMTCKFYSWKINTQFCTLPCCGVHTFGTLKTAKTFNYMLYKLTCRLLIFQPTETHIA